MIDSSNSVKDVLSESDAIARSENISNVEYRLDLNLPGNASKTYSGTLETTFIVQNLSGIFLDFTGFEITSLELNDAIVTVPKWNGHRLLIEPQDGLVEGKNSIRLKYINEYDHTGDGFHQFIDPEDNQEYVYSNFEPYSAHRLFPCFDQPNIKASYLLSVECPSDWTLIGNSKTTSVNDVEGDRTRHNFERTKLFSTYLFALVGGPYQKFESSYSSSKLNSETIPLGFYARKSLAPHVDENELFEITCQGFEYFENFFDFAYPFGKYDQIFVPEFNHGAMENVGAITHSERLVFRDPPTYNQRLTRAEVILHEMAHMWFGDLVTMKWWNDLWLNESFASYMSFLALTENTRFTDAWQSFNSRMKAWAYRQDQLVTTHPVAGEVSDTDQTFLNFDGITYGKGAAVIKQLVKTIGMPAFKSGMQRYMAKHAFSNTTLDDWLESLGEGVEQDLKGWADSWLETAQHNSIQINRTEDPANESFILISQSAPEGFPTIRSHTLELIAGNLIDSSFISTTHEIRIANQSNQINISNNTADFLFPNFGDHGYLQVTLDPKSLDFVKQHLEKITDPLLRMQIWQSLWEMVRNQELSSLDYINIAAEKVKIESDLELIQVIIEQLSAAVSRYVPEEVKLSEARKLFTLASSQLAVANNSDERILWGRAMFGFAVANDDIAHSLDIINGKVSINEFTPDQDMRWGVITSAIAAGIENTQSLVAQELANDPTDRGERAALRANTSVPDQEIKEQAWNKFTADSGYGSLHQTAAAMSGFLWWRQVDLLTPYVDRFFNEVTQVFETEENHFAQSYFGSLFPGYLVDYDLLEKSNNLLTITPPENQLLRRMLLEANDNLSRAIKCREYARK